MGDIQSQIEPDTALHDNKSSSSLTLNENNTSKKLNCTTIGPGTCYTDKSHKLEQVDEKHRFAGHKRTSQESNIPYLTENAAATELLSEIYSEEFRLFKGIIPKGKGRLVDLLSGEHPSKKSSVLEHMTLALQPILEKGIVDHSIVHRALLEYICIENKSSVTDIIQQLSGPLLVRMIHTRDGSKIGTLCIIHSGAKERKKIGKGMKGHIVKIAQDEYGCVILMCILSFIDDTSLVSKFIFRELEKDLKELALDKYGRRPLLHLLCPNAPRHFPADVLETLRSTISSLSTSTQDGLPQSTDDEHSERRNASSEIGSPGPRMGEKDDENPGFEVSHVKLQRLKVSMIDVGDHTIYKNRWMG